jgi:hypothetical protein
MDGLYIRNANDYLIILTLIVAAYFFIKLLKRFFSFLNLSDKNILNSSLNYLIKIFEWLIFLKLIYLVIFLFMIKKGMYLLVV